MSISNFVYNGLLFCLNLIKLMKINSECGIAINKNKLSLTFYDNF